MYIGVIYITSNAISQLIVLKIGTLVKLTYVINVAKFSVYRSHGWGMVNSEILRVFLYLRSRP